PALITPIGQARSVLDGHSALLPQAVTAAFLQQGHFASHLRLMRQLYHSRRDLLLTLIAQQLSPWITPIVSSGGLQVTVRLQQDEARLSALAAQQGLLLPRLSPLYAGPSS
ncbi:PLP-dependent aminotransferase family protein, partial [Pantoea agglomerans]|nr:PLP-dependent aminotransferase family protein [Pantoea agglomerans]